MERTSRIILASALAIAVAGTVVFFGLHLRTAITVASIFQPSLPDEIPSLEQNSFLFDMDGELLTEIHGPVQRITAPLDEFPDVTWQAVIATEDASFYEHDGIDTDAIVRAALRNIHARGVVEGGSTITQQYVQQVLLDQEVEMGRKLREAVWAREVEQELTKDEILERYLNAMYLGHGAYGFATAARYYFSKDVSELNLPESALLAGMIRAPRGNNPIDNPEQALTRRNIVIDQMAFHGFIDEEEAEAAKRSEIELNIREEDVGEPFWIDWLKRVVYDPSIDLHPELQEALGETTEERVTKLLEGGLRIRTSLHRGMHAKAHETLASYVSDPVEDPLGSIITINHTNGAVRAMALGPKEFGPCPEDEESCETTSVNPAVPGVGGSGRQSGSAFKPFVSAAALDRGIGKTARFDTESEGEIPECGVPGEPYAPRNYDDQSHGRVPMGTAMRQSINVYFVNLAAEIGVPSIVDTARAHGLVWSPNLPDFGERMCAIALGAADIFPLEMVVGYGVWANDGVRCAPYVIEEVRDRDGEVIYEHEPRCERVLNESVAAEMRGLLSEPVGSGGTASVVGQRLGGVYGKTGTTNNHVDAWFIGSREAFTTSAWIGFDTPTPMENVTIGGRFYSRVTGGTLPAPMWADYMSEVATE
jgi:penicillin-binding protein 1A